VTVAHKGHVKIARRAFDPEHGDPFWLEPREFSRWEAWVDVIQLAAFRARQHGTALGVVHLERGEFVASLRYLADRWTWTVKKVRNWISTLSKWARLRAQREEAAGTVYLIVNYDRYQTTGADADDEKGTGSGIARAQQGHKKEAVKQLVGETNKAVKSSAAVAPPLVIAHSWTAEGCAWWQETVGRMNPGRFGKALKPAVDQHGWPAVKIALVRWVIEKQATGGQLKLEWFADAWAQYLHLPEQPIIDENGVLTPYGDKLTRAARYA
jgi:hypothetical protein